jgi:hypothetical protein
MSSPGEDRLPDRAARRRPWVFIMFQCIIVALLALSLIGIYLNYVEWNRKFDELSLDLLRTDIAVKQLDAKFTKSRIGVPPSTAKAATPAKPPVPKRRR